jgi:uncharacterized protein YciI
MGDHARRLLDGPGMKYVVLYESAPDVHLTAPAHFPAHKARLNKFYARGELLMVGAFADPQAHGSMAIFRTRESAEAFTANDPFVIHGVVSNVDIREWNEILTD